MSCDSLRRTIDNSAALSGHEQSEAAFYFCTTKNESYFTVK